MVYITGDCHGDYHRFNVQTFPEQKEMTKNDFVIVCGDFGYWDTSKEQKWWRYWLSQKPFTLLFVDGNHENYDMLAKLPVEEWHGGKVQYIAPNVIHLMRGQVYEIENLKFFTFGGARSHDIQDGILDPEEPNFKEKYKRMCKAEAMFRVKHLSWWEEEMPNASEFEEGRRNLAQNDWQVDCIVTHCTASSTQALFGTGLFQPDELTGYLEEIRQACRYHKWFFGHYHDNRNVTDKDLMLYEQIIRIH